MIKLTPKQQRFVEEYMIDLNATQAAIRAGYSSRRAKEIGYENLTKPHLEIELEKRIASLNKKAQMKAEDVIQRLSDEANADLADLFDDNNSLKPINKWPKVFRTGLVTTVDVDQIKVHGVEAGITVKIRQSERIKRLELLGRHYGLFTGKLHTTGIVTLEHVFPAIVTEHEFAKNMEIVDE